MLKLASLFCFALCFSLSLAGAVFLGPELDQEELYNKFVSEGAPGPAVRRLLDYLNSAANHTVAVTRKNRQTGSLQKTRVQVAANFAGIIDYSKPSTEKRFFLLNLKTGKVRPFYVAHGQNSGVKYSTVFANENDSLKSSLGMVLTGDIYFGFHDKSMALFGLESSNDLVAERDIVLHGAAYATEGFITKHGRLGRSWGCTTVPKEDLENIIASLGFGSVLYLYHPALMNQALKSPKQQKWSNPGVVDMPNVFLPGEEQDLQDRSKR
jgi:hypothetical protein